MSIDSDHKKAIFRLSEASRNRMFLVLKKIFEKYETTPNDEPVYYENVSHIDSESGYNERTLVLKLQEWDIVRVDDDEETGNLLVYVDEENLNEAISLFESIISHDEGKKFEFHSLIDLKRERDTAKTVLEKLPYSTNKTISFRMSEFLSKHFTGMSIYEALDKVSQILDRFERLGLIFDKEAGQSAMQNTIYSFEPNIKALQSYWSSLVRAIQNIQGPHNSAAITETSHDWPENFKWEGNTFVFGDYGKISFSNGDAKKLFEMLTKTRGGWVTIKEMEKETGKDGTKYIRPTLGQIGKRFKGELKKHITIIPTTSSDAKGTPESGAYQIKYTADPQ